MVLKTTNCKFSGLRIYPGRGVLFIRVDGTVVLFISKKARKLHGQRKRPGRIAWTSQYRKAHKKDQAIELIRKKKKNTARVQTRAIGGASLEVIKQKKNERPEERKAAREAAAREVKERMKKLKADKAIKKQIAEKKAANPVTKNKPQGRKQGNTKR